MMRGSLDSHASRNGTKNLSVPLTTIGSPTLDAAAVSRLQARAACAHAWHTTGPVSIRHGQARMARILESGVQPVRAATEVWAGSALVAWARVRSHFAIPAHRSSSSSSSGGAVAAGEGSSTL